MSSRLDHSPADVIRYLMVQLGLGTIPEDDGSWPVFCGMEPELPDNCLTVYDTTSVKVGRFMTSGQVVQHYGIQVRVRATTNPIATAKASAILAILMEDVNLTEVPVLGETYLVQSLTLASGPLPIGPEPQGERELVTLNFTTPVKQL